MFILEKPAQISVLVSPIDLQDNEIPSQIRDLYQQALQGDLKSVYDLADHYLQGIDVTKNADLAFRLIRYAAEHHYKPAFIALGKHYAYSGEPQGSLQVVPTSV